MVLLVVEGAICKNLFLKDENDGLYLLSAVHDKDVKLKDVAKKVGVKELRIGPEMVNDNARKVKLLVDASLLDGTYKLVNFDQNTFTPEHFKKILQVTDHQVLKL